MILQQLKQNLGECKFQNKCICKDKSAYEICDEKEFFIFDPLGNYPSKIVDSKEDYHLTVKNGSKKEIVFVKPDDCLIPIEESKCDCILFDNSEIYFVELKKGGNRTLKRKEAVKQIESTIIKFKENNIEYLQMNAFAVICFKSNNIYPIRASANSKREFFRDNYQVNLIEANEINF